jgi:SAM-dependent methyltransferase
MIGSIVHLALEGAHLNALLVAVIEHRLCEHLAAGPATVRDLSARAAIAERGCQAVADGMVGLRLWNVAGGVYSNTKAAEKWLLPSSPDFVGDEHAALFRARLPMLSRVSSLIERGEPAYAAGSAELLEFWALLTPMLARKGGGVVRDAIDLLELRRGTCHLLDVGGGARALYSLAVLGANRSATATQIDWPHINRAARAAVRAAGLDDRFSTVDGDFDVVDFGAERFDVVVLSHVLHQESPDSNRELLRRIARALRPAGSVLIADWVVDDGRTGPASSLHFNLTMLLLSNAGKSYERAEITALLRAAGFEPPRFVDSEDWATLVVARKA